MSGYSIQFRSSARKDLQKLPPSILGSILESISKLAETPRPSGCKKLQGHKNLWRIRIADYRVIYEIDDKGKIIIIAAVSHRKDAY